MECTRIMMDEFGYESYANYQEAFEAWSANTTLEQIKINAELDSDFGEEGFSDLILFNLDEAIAMEGFKDKVKNMASKVKSNISLFIKKFINFFFGWLINFFKGVVNIKKSLKAGYDKAKDYLKKLDALLPKVRDIRNKDGESKTISIAEHASKIIECMCVVLGVSFMLKKSHEIFSAIFKDQSAQNVSAEASLQVMSASAIAMGGLAIELTPQKTDSYEKFKARGYKIEVFAKDIINIANDKSVIKGIAEKLGNTVGATAKVLTKILGAMFLRNSASEVVDAMKELAGFKGKEDDDELNNSIKDSQAIMKQEFANRAQRLESSEPTDVPLDKAYSMIREGLTGFITIAEANKDLWNFEKYIQDFTKLQSKLNSLAERNLKLDQKTHVETVEQHGENSDEANAAANQADDQKSLLNHIVAAGALMNTVSGFANKCMSKTNDMLGGLFADTAKLGTALTTMGGK